MCVKEEEEETQNKQQAKSAPTGFHINKDDNTQHANTENKQTSFSGEHQEFCMMASIM